MLTESKINLQVSYLVFQESALFVHVQNIIEIFISQTFNIKYIAVVMIKSHFTFVGRDFPTDDAITAEKQVDLLVKQATSHENLCQCYIGWFVLYSLLFVTIKFVLFQYLKGCLRETSPFPSTHLSRSKIYKFKKLIFWSRRDYYMCIKIKKINIYY